MSYKKMIHLLIYSFIFSCQAQLNTVNSKEKDILVVSLLDSQKNIENTSQVYHYKNFFIVQRIRASYNYDIFYNQFDFQFIQKKDTMNIVCICEQGKNYYFKNLEFKNGNYELKMEYPKKYDEKEQKYGIKHISGSEIKTPKEVQSILFKDVDYNVLRKPEYKDTYFKDLKFIEINFKDTINVKLIETKKPTNKK